MNQNLVNYIKQAREHGMSDEEIHAELIKTGWREEEIENALHGADKPAAPSAQSQKSDPENVQDGTSKVGQSPEIQGSDQANAGQLKSPAKMLGDAFRIYKENIKILTAVVLTPFALWAVLSIIIAVFGLLRGYIDNNPDFSSTGLIINIVLMLIGLIVLIVGIYVAIWSQVAILTTVKDIDKGITWKEAYKQTRSRVGKYLWVAFLSGFIVYGGWLLFIVPGIVFLVWFSFSAFVFVHEDERGMRALLKSREYVKNYFGPVLWRIVVIAVFVGLVAVIPALIFELFNLGYIAGIVNTLISVIISPLSIIYLTLLYRELKFKKGEVAVNLSKRKWFITVAIFGLIAIPIFLFLYLVIMLGVNTP